MREYFDIVPMQPIEPAPHSLDEFARGDYWALLKREEGYVLEYISGEMYAHLKQLMRGEIESEQILLAHSAS